MQINAQEWNTAVYLDNGWKIEDISNIDIKKRNLLLLSKASLYSVTLVSLNQLWYSDYPKSNFHFIDDNQEWLQMDKIGHMTTSYYSGVIGIKAYKWAGFDRKSAIWYGGLTGTFFLTIIEVLDGYSKEWGASSGDLIANTTGSLLAITQALRWNEQRIQLKYSYFPTQFPTKNSEQLGGNHLERSLKDYNGQTYWMSFNLKSLFQIGNNDFPQWISLSLGYSATGMETAYRKDDDKQATREYFFSFDIDLNKIKTKSKILNSVLQTFGFLKFPAPAIQYSKGNIFFHPIFY